MIFLKIYMHEFFEGYKRDGNIGIDDVASVEEA